MKQKNLVLMVVAVGCGLVAAFLTSMMAGGQKKEDTIEILVAAKELKPGDKFTKDSLKDQVKRKPMLRSTVPPNAADREEDLLDKQLIKGLREGDHISVADTGVWEPLKPPSGHDLITLRLGIEQMTPFVKATSHINLFGTVQNRKSQAISGSVLIPDLLVMAIDADVRPGGGDQGTLNKQVVTLAATPDECTLIREAQRAGVDLSFILLNNDNLSSNPKKGWTLDGARKWVNEALLGKEGAPNSTADLQGPRAQPNTPAPAPAPATPAKKLVKYVVPKENVNPGTALTADVITDKFQEKEAEKLPDGALTDLKPYLGKYVIGQMWKGEAITRDSIGDDPKSKTPVAPPPQEKEKRKYTEFDRNFFSGTVKQYRYRLYEGDKEPVLMGEVVNGELVPVTGAPALPDDKKQPKKNEGKNEGTNPDDKKVSSR